MSNNKILTNILAVILLIILPILYKTVFPLLPAYSEFSMVYDIIVVLPMVLMISGLLISIKIKEVRAFWDMVLFTWAYIIIVNFKEFQFGGLQLADIAQSLSVFVPVGIILISFRPQKEFSRNGFIYQLLIILTIMALTFIIPLYFETFFDIVFSSHIFINHPDWKIPDYVWFIMIIMAAVLLLRSDRNNRPLLITLIASVFLLFQTLNLAAVVNYPTHEVKLFIALIFLGMAFFPHYFMIVLHKRKKLYNKLTGLPNEVYLQNVVKKYNDNYSLAIIEIDRCNEFIDEYGESEKNNLLRFITSHLKTESDAEVYILKDNKFALVYTKATSDEILWQLNSIKEKLSHKKFIIRMPEKHRNKAGKYSRGKLEKKSNDITATISIGIAGINGNIQTYKQVFEEALYALNTAKTKGGNRCIRAEDVTY